MKQRTIIAAIIAALAVSNITASAASTFTDIADGKWYTPGIIAIADKGLISGYPDGTFRPEATVTYGEFLSMALQATGETVPITRKEGEHWAIDYYRHGIKRGYYEATEINATQLSRPISRSYMALIVSGILGDCVDVSGEYYTALQNSVSDVDSRTPYEYQITRAYGAGILSGYTDHTFRPNATLTRAQAASVIWKLIDESQRTVLKMEELQVQPTVDRRTQEERIAEILQNGTPNIIFNPSTDTTKNENGYLVMKEEKAREYMDVALSTLRFYGENGKYYMTITFPELPEGYKFSAAFETVYTEKANKPIWGVTTGWTMVETNKIPATGTVTKEITNMKAVNELLMVNSEIAVVADDGTVHGSSESHYAMQRAYRNGISDSFGLNRQDAAWATGDLVIPYKLDRHFIWK